MWCSAIACIIMLILSLLVGPLATEAQQATTVYRIGRLSPGPPLPEPDRREAAFRQGLRDLGYVEGHNLVMVYRYAGGTQTVSTRWQPS